MTAATDPHLVRLKKGAEEMAEANGITKRCPGCGETKDMETGFSRARRSPDGAQSRCKACNAEYVSRNRERMAVWGAQYRAANSDKIRAKNARYYTQNREALLAAGIEYYEAHREEIIRKSKARDAANPEQYAAHRVVSAALRSGMLIPQPCEKCGLEPSQRGRQRIQAHHDDYSKPLEVRWLCVKHHRRHHNQERMG